MNAQNRKTARRAKRAYRADHVCAACGRNVVADANAWDACRCPVRMTRRAVTRTHIPDAFVREPGLAPISYGVLMRADDAIREINHQIARMEQHVRIYGGTPMA